MKFPERFSRKPEKPNLDHALQEALASHASKLEKDKAIYPHIQTLLTRSLNYLMSLTEQIESGSISALVGLERFSSPSKELMTLLKKIKLLQKAELQPYIRRLKTIENKRITFNLVFKYSDCSFQEGLPRVPKIVDSEENYLNKIRQMEQEAWKIILEYKNLLDHIQLLICDQNIY